MAQKQGETNLASHLNVLRIKFCFEVISAKWSFFL